MDLASLEAFRTVAREESVTRAAALLDRAPSNITTRIQQIEADIGVPLFKRETRRMLLTDQGRTFLAYAERILNLAEEARQVVNPQGPAGTLRIGSMESTAATRLPIPLAQFNRAWPDVTIELSTSPTRQLVDALVAHRIDCALMAVPKGEWWLSPEELDLVPLFREDLLLALPPGHGPVERPQDIRPAALAAFAPGCTYRMLAEEWVAGFGPNKTKMRVQEVRSYHAMMACTAAGACFSILPRSVFETMPDASHFTVTTLGPVETCLASRPGFETPAFAEFRRMLKAFSNIGESDDATA